MNKKVWLIALIAFFALGGVGGIPLIALVAMTATPPEEHRPDAPGEVDGIPETMLSAYQQAADGAVEHVPECEGMTWAVVAGVAKVESEHASGSTVHPDGAIDPPIIGPTLDGSGAGGNTTPHPDTDGGEWDNDDEYDAAVGPLQFIPATWTSVGRSDREGHDPDPHNAYDAALTAAIYLCGDEPTDLSDDHDLAAALWSYNQSETYGDQVSEQIEEYEQMSNSPQEQEGSGSNDEIITAAEDWLGTPYEWGGECRDPARDRCDCSSLTRYAYSEAADIELPRTTYDQVELPESDPRFKQIDDVSDLEAGDMLFFGTSAPDGIYHVALYIDEQRMIEAPRTGLDVRVADDWQQRSDFYGGVGLRPAGWA